MRKIIQISAVEEDSRSVAGDRDTCVFALCNDGTLWSFGTNEEVWYGFPDIPQPALDSSGDSNDI